MKLLHLTVVYLISFSSFARTPDSLTRLATIKDKSSDDYMFLAQEAAIDTKNASERMLDGENSAGALKILEVAIHLMPHRTDLNHLRKKSLQTFLQITKELEKDAVKNCSLLQERYTFLKSIAPDALAKLKLEKSCALELKVGPVETDAELLKLPEPKILKNLEIEFKPELVKTFPWDDVLANSFMLLRSLYGEEFSVVCDQFKDGKGVCTKPSVTTEDFSATSLQYCGYVEGLLSVSTGTKLLMCTYNKKQKFKTNEELYQIYEKIFDNKAFDDDIPSYVITTVSFKYTDRVEHQHVLSYLDHASMRKNLTASMTFVREAHFKDLVGSALSHTFGEAQLKGLVDLTLVINYKRTFELYQRNFQKSLKRNLPKILEEDFKKD
jgi:hypothetical protein